MLGHLLRPHRGLARQCLVSPSSGTAAFKALAFSPWGLTVGMVGAVRRSGVYAQPSSPCAVHLPAKPLLLSFRDVNAVPSVGNYSRE